MAVEKKKKSASEMAMELVKGGVEQANDFASIMVPPVSMLNNPTMQKGIKGSLSAADKVAETIAPGPYKAVSGLVSGVKDAFGGESDLVKPDGVTAGPALEPKVGPNRTTKDGITTTNNFGDGSSTKYSMPGGDITVQGGTKIMSPSKGYNETSDPKAMDARAEQKKQFDDRQAVAGGYAWRPTTNQKIAMAAAEGGQKAMMESPLYKEQVKATQIDNEMAPLRRKALEMKMGEVGQDFQDELNLRAKRIDSSTAINDIIKAKKKGVK